MPPQAADLSSSGPLLAFETSGRSVGVALWGASGLLAEKRAGEGSRHGAALAPLTEELLRHASVTVKDLSAIGVSLGPGSWTGLRIGLAAAKAMAWGAGLALVGVPSLEALALSAFRSLKREGESAGKTLAEHGQPTARAAHGAHSINILSTSSKDLTAGVASRRVLTLRHAYAEGIYLAFWRETLEAPERLIPECVLKPEQLCDIVRQSLDEPRYSSRQELWVCGDAVCLTALDAFSETSDWRRLKGLEEIPPAVLAEIAWNRLRAGKAWRTAAEIHAAAPLYLRASDPELKLKRRRSPES